MRVLRIVLALPFLLVGAYLGLVSFLAGCVIQSSAVSRGDVGQLLLMSQGLPPTIGTWLVGIVGMLLIGIGFAIATGGSRRP